MKAANRLGRGVERAGPDDLPDVLAFQARFYGPKSRQVDPAVVGWRLTDHPLVAGDGPEVWLCRRDHQVVGAQVGLPVDLNAGGRGLRALWAIDLMVAPEWRLRGIAPALILGLSNSAPVVVGLGVAEAAQRAFRRAGWFDLGDVPRWWRLLRPLPETVAGRWPGRLSRALAPALALADGVIAPLMDFATGTRAVAVNSFDERIDAVWQNCRKSYPVMARRDLPALRWRFDAAPSAGAYRRFMLLKRGRPMGYFVLRDSTDRRRGLHRALLIDFLCPPAWQPVLLAYAVREARRTGATLLQCLCPAPAAGPALRALGFMPRPGQRLMVHIRPDAEESFRRLCDPALWFVTLADSDLDHLPLPEEWES